LVRPAGAAALAAIISGKYQHSPNEKLAILIVEQIQLWHQTFKITL